MLVVLKNLDSGHHSQELCLPLNVVVSQSEDSRPTKGILLGNCDALGHQLCNDAECAFNFATRVLRADLSRFCATLGDWRPSQTTRPV